MVLHESWWPSAVDFPAGCPKQPNPAPSPPPPPDGPQWLPYGGPPYTQPGQQQYFSELLSKKNTKFVWGGSLDTPSLYDGCKQPPPAGYGGAPGHHWGLWSQSADGISNTPKQAVQSVDYGGY
ncbi:MAG: hypothetical protein IPK93_02350 [Solirubrobacterales bacterium]|nr:hypothetical protein [Solirubrobacterales bacterium]